MPLLKYVHIELELAHNDINERNLLFNSQTNKPLLIDWSGTDGLNMPAQQYSARYSCPQFLQQLIDGEDAVGTIWNDLHCLVAAALFTLIPSWAADLDAAIGRAKDQDKFQKIHRFWSDKANLLSPRNCSMRPKL